MLCSWGMFIISRTFARGRYSFIVSVVRRARDEVGWSVRGRERGIGATTGGQDLPKIWTDPQLFT